MNRLASKLSTDVHDDGALAFKSPLASVSDSDWYFEFVEMHDLRICEISVLEEAYKMAPTEEVKAYVCAIYDVRSAMCALNGRRMSPPLRDLDIGISLGNCPATNVNEGRALITAVADSLSGSFTAWYPRGTWQTSTLTIGDVEIDIRVSTAGVVHVNGNAFSPLGRKTNVTSDALRASLEAVLNGTAVSFSEPSTTEMAP